MTERRTIITPPAGLDPALARFIEELARAAVRRERRKASPSETAHGHRTWAPIVTDRFRTLDQLPLFASEADIAAALMGPSKVSYWRQIAPLLERRGLPTIDVFMGGRYTPAIRVFFDREYGIHGPVQRSAPDGPEKLGTWKRQRGNRRFKVGQQKETD